jgi:uncharacterized protein YjbI with pentapeptide repeats
MTAPTTTIKNRWTDEVIKTVEAESLRRADLEGADLRSADLEGADLYGADLEGADLEGADLRRADLEGADLRRADLRRADLYGADLRRADLEGADLEGANLEGVREALGITFDPELPGRIVAQIEAYPESHDQEVWHSECGTRHCIAGFATHLSGPLGKFLDKQLGTSTAATLLLWRAGAELPSFEASATDAETIDRLRAMMVAK